MKTLRIILIALMPALGFVGCQKSEIKPACTDQTTEAPATTEMNTRTRGGVITSEPAADTNPSVDEIVGSGDDDRDGGDKKAKAVGR